jgi:hypothetical protein
MRLHRGESRNVQPRKSNRSALSGEAQTGYELPWNKATQSVANEDALMLSLLFTVIILLSLYFAILLDPPSAEALLQIPV